MHVRETSAGSAALYFEPFRFEIERGDLYRDGSRVPLRPKATRVLAALLERPGSLVTHEELVRAAWGDVHGEVESSLHNVISEIRDALGDTAGQPRYVQTVHRRGYCFVADVQTLQGDSEELPADREAVPADAEARESRDDDAAAWGSPRGRQVLVTLVVLAIVGVLGALGLAERSGDADPPAARPSDVLVEGRYLVDHGRPDEIRRGRDMIRQALAGEAANSALAWGSLATADVALWNLDEAAEAAQRALELDPESADAFRVLAQLDMYVHRDWEGAERNFLRSLSLDSEVAGTHVAFGTLLLILGRQDEALREARLARSLAPLSPEVNQELAWVLALNGRFEEAAEQARRTLELDPEHPDAYAVLHTARWSRREYPGARHALVESLARREAPAEILEAMRTAPPMEGLRIGYRWFADRMLGPEGVGHPHRHHRTALAYMFLGQHEDALEHLLVAERRNEPMFPMVGVDPRFAPLRPRPEFRALLERLGLQPRP